MDLTTELLDNAAFREAKRGYNTQEVDEFIEQVKVEYGRHDAMVREARQRVDAAEARVADAERRASEAAERAAATTDDDDTLKRTLILAQRTADAAIKEADEQAARTLASAQDQAARVLADAQEATARARADAESEARRAQEEAREKVLAELNDLEAAREQLKGDVSVLDKHVEAQRARVRLATTELQRLLDDPAALRQAPAPDVSDIVVATPAPAALAEPTPLFSHEPAPGPEVAALAADGAVDAPDALSGPPSSSSTEKALTAAGDAIPPPPPPPPPSLAYAAPEPRAKGQGEASQSKGQSPEGESKEGESKEGESPGDQSTDTIDLLEEREPGDDAYLAELRKAMTDESPLGPREEGDIDPLFDSGSEQSRTRFGRRR